MAVTHASLGVGDCHFCAQPDTLFPKASTGAINSSNQALGKEEHSLKVNRRDMLRSCVAASAALAAGTSMRRASAQSRPNIVVIMADDIGFECYGAYGSTHYQTPRFDALASRGRNDAEDRNLDRDGDGFTNLEEYLAALCE